MGDRKPRVVSWCDVNEKRRGSGRRLAIGDARGSLEIGTYTGSLVSRATKDNPR